MSSRHEATEVIFQINAKAYLSGSWHDAVLEYSTRVRVSLALSACPNIDGPFVDPTHRMESSCFPIFTYPVVLSWCRPAVKKVGTIRGA